MRILGIDPALKITGFGIIDVRNNSLCLYRAGAIITSSKELLPLRLEKIYRALCKLIDESKPKVMVVEKIYVHYHHTTTAYILGQARGLVLLAAAQNKIPLIEYSATRVKKAIVGRGLASKQQVQKMVLGTLNLNTVPEYMDVTDALALAIAYKQISGVKV
ncbi:MAG: crossover junction endodeoxyribonuclease RuvC [Candidatus Omnitrophota bacterium]